jgi:hypothetical protein
MIDAFLQFDAHYSRGDKLTETHFPPFSELIKTLPANLQRILRV